MILHLVCFIIVLNRLGLSNGQWSYSGPTGPSNWWKLPGAQSCHGRKQSPININTYETGQKSFPPFVLENYGAVPPGSATRPTSMVNMGHTLQVNLEGNYFLSGGGLPNKYKAIEFHLHWGSDNTRGSEHTKNGIPYPAEMHIVHYNHVKFRTVGDAISKPNGIAFLGFWIKLGRHNPAWDPIINNLKNIKYANNPHIFTAPFELTSLLPTDLSRFYRYSGSLTTPGCYESVIWTVFDNEITLSRAQLAKLRQLSKFETPPYGPGAGPELHKRLVDNFRPIQRLWFRTIYQSWPHASYSYYGGMGNGAAMTPKVAAFPGLGPAPPAGAAPPAGPARLEDENADLEADYTGAGTGLQGLWNAFMNGEYGGEPNDFYYYGNDYGNNNKQQYSSDWYTGK